MLSQLKIVESRTSDPVPSVQIDSREGISDGAASKKHYSERCQLYYTIRDHRWKNSWPYDSGTNITVKPGTTSTIEIGGGGRSVSGKVKLVGATTKATVGRCNGSIHTHMPKSPQMKTIEETIDWMKTAEYKQMMKTYQV